MPEKWTGDPSGILRVDCARSAPARVTPTEITTEENVSRRYKFASARYQQILAKYTLAAQILLPDDKEDRTTLNARSTLNQLLQLGVIPVINENDTVATNEIRFGDNDRLGARVAAMISADCLLLLSDIDGLYEEDPRINPNAKHIAEVAEVTADIEAMATSAPVGYSSAAW